MLSTLRSYTRLLPLATNRVPLRLLRRAVSSDPADNLRFTRAVFGSIPKSLVAYAIRAEEPEVPIDFQKAIRQHENYMSQVKKLIPTTVQIPPHEEFPDMVFVEDPAIVNGNRALITRMGPRSRDGEVNLIRPVLQDY